MANDDISIGEQIIIDNVKQDPNYRPYCLRCTRMTRMSIVAPWYWRCACGAESDMRAVVKRLEQPEKEE